MLILHVITSLKDGGAEGVLYRLCTHDKMHSHVVISLMDEGKYGPMLRSKGIEVITLGMRPNLPSPVALIKLIQLFRNYNPNVVQTWMLHADLIGGIAARIARRKAIIWGIRQTILEPGKSKITTIWIAKLLAKLSWWMPTLIAVCAHRAIDVHEALGYERAKMRYIPNGYNLAGFTRRLDEACTLRAQWDVGPNIPLIGTVGRYDPYKDYTNLLHALGLLRSRNISLLCVFVGTNLDSENQEFLAQIQHLGLKETVMLFGRRTDIPAVMSALDLHVLSSSAEAFPNVVAEAMACETPCVVTDVGDAAHIVGNTGWVVPPRDPEALANSIEKALSASQHDDWEKRCVLARKRIEEYFSIQRMVAEYSTLWHEAVTQCAD
ncbi:MAG: glycosyltransferase [Alphaproteobacteria bacterium]|nr:glycosyltransferase [Alphaproteobacteria bacterium]